MELTDRYKGMRVLLYVIKGKVDLVKIDRDVNSRMAFKEQTPKILWRTNFIMSITIEIIKYEVLTGSLFYSNDAVYIKRFNYVFKQWWNYSLCTEEVNNLKMTRR